MAIDHRDVTPTGLTVLGLVNAQPRGGYEIRQASQRLGSFWGASFGQIYPQLRALEASALIRAVHTDDRSTTFGITAAGRKVLRSWLLDPESTYSVRDEGLAKFVLSTFLPVDDRIEIVRHRRTAVIAATKHLSGITPEHPTLQSDLAIRFGQMLNQAVLDWCDLAIAELERERDETHPP